MRIEDAVDEAIDDCLRQDILRDFLIRNKAEAKHMSIYEYNEELHLRNLLEQGREEGREQGREEGRKEERENTEREKRRADAAEAEIKALKKKIRELEAERG